MSNDRGKGRKAPGFYLTRVGRVVLACFLVVVATWPVGIQPQATQAAPAHAPQTPTPPAPPTLTSTPPAGEGAADQPPQTPPSPDNLPPATPTPVPGPAQPPATPAVPPAVIPVLPGKQGQSETAEPQNTPVPTRASISSSAISQTLMMYVDAGQIHIYDLETSSDQISGPEFGDILRFTVVNRTDFYTEDNAAQIIVDQGYTLVHGIRSPDGQRAVYLEAVCQQNRCAPQFQLWLADSNQQQLWRGGNRNSW